MGLCVVALSYNKIPAAMPPVGDDTQTSEQIEKAIEDTETILHALVQIRDSEENRTNFSMMQEKVMKKLHDLSFQQSVDLRVKYRKEFEWLQCNYIDNIDAGNQMIQKLTAEINSIANNTWPQEMQVLLNEHTSINENVKQGIEEFFNDIYTRSQATTEIGLREGLLLDSTIHKKLKELEQK